MVVAPISPPPSELSLPITAFCTTLLIRSSTTRSKALSWPSCRLPQRRKATSRNTYTAPERSTFSAMLMSGTRMFMRFPPSASHPSRRIEAEFDTRAPSLGGSRPHRGGIPAVEEDAHVRSGCSGADVDPADRGVEDPGAGPLAGPGDPRVQTRPPEPKPDGGHGPDG